MFGMPLQFPLLLRPFYPHDASFLPVLAAAATCCLHICPRVLVLSVSVAPPPRGGRISPHPPVPGSISFGRSSRAHAVARATSGCLSPPFSLLRSQFPLLRDRLLFCSASSASAGDAPRSRRGSGGLSCDDGGFCRRVFTCFFRFWFMHFAQKNRRRLLKHARLRGVCRPAV